MSRILESQDISPVFTLRDIPTSFENKVIATYGLNFMKIIKRWVASPEYGQNGYRLNVDSSDLGWIDNDDNPFENVVLFDYIQGQDAVTFNSRYEEPHAMSRKFIDNYLESITSIGEDVVFKLNYLGKDIYYSVNNTPGERVELQSF